MGSFIELLTPLKMPYAAAKKRAEPIRSFEMETRKAIDSAGTDVWQLLSDKNSATKCGVPNRNMSLSMPHLAYLIIPFSGAIKMAA